MLTCALRQRNHPRSAGPDEAERADLRARGQGPEIGGCRVARAADAGHQGAASLFGEPFMGPMEGHEPLIPKDYVHYDLHMWLFKPIRWACSRLQTLWPRVMRRKEAPGNNCSGPMGSPPPG